jgi:hypothetical protein
MKNLRSAVNVIELRTEHYKKQIISKLKAACGDNNTAFAVQLKDLHNESLAAEDYDKTHQINILIDSVNNAVTLKSILINFESIVNLGHVSTWQRPYLRFTDDVRNLVKSILNSEN